jgi:hypothetical protein
MLRFPLLAVSLAVYMSVQLATPGAMTPWYESQALSLNMPSGDVWRVTSGDIFLVFSIGLLLAEYLRTRGGRETIIHHALSVSVFVISLMLFMGRPGYGNSTFFIFVAVCLVHIMIGFIIGVIAARRDFALMRMPPTELNR